MLVATDVLVIGAGLAGAAAALKLGQAGLRVQVLEARERVGGRGYARAFQGTKEILDFGGAWITPWQTRIRELCAAFGVKLRPRTPLIERRWFRDGALHKDGPTSMQDRARHERVIARIAADAVLLKMGHERNEQGDALTGVTFSDYINRLNPPEATRHLLSAWWTVSGNADKSVAPASEFLHSSAYGGGLAESIIDVWTHSLEGGVSLLAERMLAASGAKVRTGAVVLGLKADDQANTAQCADGSHWTARAILFATGLNPLRNISIAPKLSDEKRNAIALGHAGRAVKIWVQVEGVAPGILVTGGGHGIEFMLSERRSGGQTYIVGFGVADRTWWPDLPHDGVDAVQRFFPEARVRGIDHHDWNADPYSLGAWVAAIAGREKAHAYENWRREGAIAFASSDIAPDQAGWFEAAILSGEAAAEETLEFLKRRLC